LYRQKRGGDREEGKIKYDNIGGIKYNRKEMKTEELGEKI